MSVQKLVRRNLLKGKVPNKSGVYVLYNTKKKPIYVGTSRILRHRLQSYVQQDDFREHPTKRALRKRAAYFSYTKKPIRQARRIERVRKKNYPHNHK